QTKPRSPVGALLRPSSPAGRRLLFLGTLRGWAGAGRAPGRRQDEHLAVVPLALAACRHRGIILEGHMDDPAVAWTHRVESDRAAGLLGLLGEPACQLVQILPPSPPVALHLDHEAGGRAVLGPGYDTVTQALEPMQG